MTVADVPGTDVPGVLIVTGMPGAGKSTVTQLAAEKLARSARMDGDFVNRLVVGGRVWALGEPADEAARQVELCNRNLCALAANFADAGFTAIIDWIIPNHAQFDLFLELLAPRPVMFVVLSPGIAACEYRNTIRHPDHQFFFDGYETLEAAMHDELGDVGWWFDTSELSPEETVEQILSQAPQRALVT
jgi:hypothetical protein